MTVGITVVDSRNTSHALRLKSTTASGSYSIDAGGLQSAVAMPTAVIHGTPQPTSFADVVATGPATIQLILNVASHPSTSFHSTEVHFIYEAGLPVALTD